MELKCCIVYSYTCFLDILKTSNPLYRWNGQPAYELKAVLADLLTSRLESYSCLNKNFSIEWLKYCLIARVVWKKMVCHLLPHQKLVKCRKFDSNSAALFKCIWDPSPIETGALGWEDCLLLVAIWAMTPASLWKNCTVVVALENHL